MDDICDDYEEDCGAATALPTLVLQLWDRRAAERILRPPTAWSEGAQLMRVRSVLQERER